MSDGINRVMLLGNLGQDPELRHTGAGTAILAMRLATNEQYQQDGERKDRVEWHTVIVWGKRASGLHSVLQKGAKVFIEGRLQTRSWEGKDGGKQYRTEIVASNVVLLGGTRAQQRPARQESDELPHGWHDPDDEIPF